MEGMDVEEKWFCYIERIETHSKPSELIYEGKPISLRDAKEIIGKHVTGYDPVFYRINNIHSRKGRIIINQQEAVKYDQDDVRINRPNKAINLGVNNPDILIGLSEPI